MPYRSEDQTAANMAWQPLRVSCYWQAAISLQWCHPWKRSLVEEEENGGRFALKKARHPS